MPLAMIAVFGQTLFFALTDRCSLLLVPASLVPALVLGAVLRGFERLAERAQRWLGRQLPRLHANFVLFFIYLLAYVIAFSLLVSYPLEWCNAVLTDGRIGNGGGQISWVDLGLVLAVVGWIGRTASPGAAGAGQ